MAPRRFKPFDEEPAHFHCVLQIACGPDRYARFSRWAREYFFIPHRNSERGVGGVFFDYLRGEEGGSPGVSLEESFSFLRVICDAFLPPHSPIVERPPAP